MASVCKWQQLYLYYNVIAHDNARGLATITVLLTLGTNTRARRRCRRRCAPLPPRRDFSKFSDDVNSRRYDWSVWRATGWTYWTDDSAGFGGQIRFWPLPIAAWPLVKCEKCKHTLECGYRDHPRRRSQRLIRGR